MTYTLIKRDDLPKDGNTFEFEGMHFDSTAVSFIWVDMPSGDAVRLHRHAYQEIFIIQEGSGTFTVDGEMIEGKSGDIILVPAGVPHGFVNSGEGRLKQIDIHVSPIIKTEWL